MINRRTRLITAQQPCCFMTACYRAFIFNLMLTKIEEQKFEAKMSFGNGYSDWLPVVKRIDKNGKEEIIFCRDENHVHAWHCNSLPIDDYRVLDVRPLNAI